MGVFSAIVQLGHDLGAVRACVTEEVAGLTGADGAHQVAERLAREIREPFAFEDAPLSIDASIGLALFPEDATEPDRLLEEADRSMYAIKRSRKGEAS